jgi:hypothetical protein
MYILDLINTFKLFITSFLLLDDLHYYTIADERRVIYLQQLYKNKLYQRRCKNTQTHSVEEPNSWIVLQ